MEESSRELGWRFADEIFRASWQWRSGGCVPAGDDLAAASFSDSQERPDVPLWDQQLCHNQLAAARLGLRREPLGRVLV